MTKKTMAIVAYITIIGWIVVYLEHKKSADKSPLVNYHLGQSLGLIILSFVLGIVFSIVAMLVPALVYLSTITGLITFVLLLLGIVAASNEAMKPLPVVGGLFEGKFDFSK